MNYSAIAVRYSKALLSLSEEKGILDQVQKDIALIQSVCETENEFRRLLEFPVIPTSKKIEIFNEIFKDKVSNLTLEFLKMIADNRREAFLYHMTHAFMGLYKTKLGIKTVTFTSVDAIDDNTRKLINDMVKEHYKADIELIEETNKDLIGGFVLRVDDEQFDASVANRLEKIRREFIN